MMRWNRLTRYGQSYTPEERHLELGVGVEGETAG